MFKIMAATAKHDLRQNFPNEVSGSTVEGAGGGGGGNGGGGGGGGGDEDIAAIAKQISDHAEAIYQTWKSRGLAPTEILNCHSNATAADKFDSVLKPVVGNTSTTKIKNYQKNNSSSPRTAVELLAQAPTLDNNKLEKLVNNFVVEDKARLAAAASNSTLRCQKSSPSSSSSSSPSKTALRSSIQLALEKFETRCDNNFPSGSTTSRVLTKVQQQHQNRTTQLNEEETKKFGQESYLDTIETTFPSDVTPQSRIVQVREKRPASVTSFVMRDRPTSNPTSTTSGLTTWPLKNKITNGKVNKVRTPSNVAIGGFVNKLENIKDDKNTCIVDSESVKDNGVKTCHLADEVAREEERLIKALMTGSVIPEEPLTKPRNVDGNLTTSGSVNMRQKPAVKKDKPKVEPVKPIILSPGLLQTNIESRSMTKEDLSSLSAVDYAKIRYRAAQQQNPGVSGSEKIRKIVGVVGKTNDKIDTEKEEEDKEDELHRNSHLNHHHLHHHHHHHHHHHRNANNRRNQNQSKNNIVKNSEDNHQADDEEEDEEEDEEKVNLNEKILKNIVGVPQRTVSAARNKFEPTLINSDIDNISSSSSSTTTTITTINDIKNSAGSSSRWGPRVNSTPSSRPRLEQLVPHPELTTQQRQHIRANAATGTGSNPIRPFLTRGSVAERVLIFEKCPSELLLDKRGPRQPAIVTWRTGHEVLSKAQSYARERTLQPQKNLPTHTTLQRHVKANRNVLIPRFFFPGGKPIPTCQLDATLSRISNAFQTLPGQRASKNQFHIIAKACDCPLYWKVPLFLAAGGEKNGYVDQNGFIEYWQKWSGSYHDPSSRFVSMITKGLRDFIVPEDLIPLVQDVVETHPGLTFLKEAKEFHSRYVHTVVARIFYSVNRSWSGKITVSELRRSNLLAVISVLEHEEDINQVTAYFSYEHFYVIYCKFWELDLDHDLFIDSLDLTRHNDNALSTRMIERIFSGAVTRGGVRASGVTSNNSLRMKRNHPEGAAAIEDPDLEEKEKKKKEEEEEEEETINGDDEIDRYNKPRLGINNNNINNNNNSSNNNNNNNHNHQQRQIIKSEENKMSYTEFVWFLLSEEDKNHPTAIEYWFRCMDLDGDGFLSMYELEYFYEEQLHRMEAIGIETLPFEDCLCQMLDMIRPTVNGKISLSDLKKCKMTSIFFDTFFNLEKYLDHEQRDPFASARDHDADGHELSDWDRFAAEEYELLVAEEGGNEQNEQIFYESSNEDGNHTSVDILPPDTSAEIVINSCCNNRYKGLYQLSKGNNDYYDEYDDDDAVPTAASSSLSNSYNRSSIIDRKSKFENGDSDDYADSDD